MPKTLLLNNMFLFLCCSIYLGTGVSLVFFQLPVEPQITTENYRLFFIEPLRLATVFLTWMTVLMLISGTVMAITEWWTGIRWVPLVVLVLIIAATLLTQYGIFPYNDRMRAGVTDPAELDAIVHRWAHLCRVRAAIWAVQWLAMAYWFSALALKARADR